MTKRHYTSHPPLLSTTRRSRWALHDEDINDDLSTIPDDYNDCDDDNSEADDNPLRRPSMKAMRKWPSKDSFTSTLGKLVAAPQLTPTSAQQPTSWVLRVLCWLGGDEWIPACSTGIHKGIRLSVGIIESAHYCIYSPEEWFKQSRWAIGSMESWKSVVIWALHWWHDRPHCQCRIQRPYKHFRRSSNSHGMYEAHSYQ